MIIALITGAVIGFVLAIPPGPIGMAVIRTGLREGWTSSLRLSFGAGVFDALYCGLAMIAAGYITQLFDTMEHASPLAPVLIQLVIVLAMIILGLLQLRVRPGMSASGEPEIHRRQGSSLQQWMRSHGPFFIGVGYALANLANPTFIPALSVMTTAVQSSDWYVSNLVNNVIFSLAFGLGNVSWLALLSRLVITQQHRMTPTFIRRIQQLSGLTLIGFGTMFGVRILATTKWTEILRLVLAF